MSKRIIEKLEAELEEKDEKISYLEEKIDNLKYADEWKWRHIRTLTAEENMDLPTPRLEIREKVVSEFEIVATYGLVRRNLFEEIIFMPFSSVKVSGSKAVMGIYKPLRMTGDMYNDMFELGLKGFIIFEDCVEEISLENTLDLPQALLVRMEKKNQTKM